MSTSPELEPELDDDEAYRRERMEMLAEVAVVCRPRLFAVHGLYDSDGRDILGWGLEFPDDNRAIFTDPTGCSAHHSNTAGQVLRKMSVIGDVRLTWLDHE